MHTQQGHLDNIEQLQGSIEYCGEALSQPDIKNWEKKEYESVLGDREIELMEAQKHVDFMKEIGHWDKMPKAVGKSSFI